MVTHARHLSTAAGVLLVGVLVLLPRDGVAGHATRVTDGPYVLELRSTSSTYASGAPIALSASLTYTGPLPSVEIQSTSPKFGFAIRQAVFGERLSTVFQAIRSRSTLVRGAPLTVKSQYVV